MSTRATPPAIPSLVYPDSDGRPMAENTLQFQWIVTIKEGLEALFADRPDVFVAGDLLWYPVEGEPKTRAAPDALVAFGRPKGYRGSYKQWEEGCIPPQVVFEVLSPGNSPDEMNRKRDFYQRHGVEEYYLYDPDAVALDGWLRDDHDGTLQPIPDMRGWTSPRLGVRFDLDPETLRLIRPDGRPFQTYLELFQTVEAQRARADDERRRADLERERADEERRRADRLAERLRALGIDPESE
ncbi:MAG: Uma2 family endonuclease [Isosphaeraceae bacterium]